MNKIFTATISIPVYNEERNIENLLDDILRQKIDGVTLKEIIVINDASTDNTIAEVKKIKSNKLKIIQNHKRIGKPQSLNKIFRKVTSDFLVLFDGDIRLINEDTIKQLLIPLMADKKIALTSGMRIPANQKSFVARSLATSIRAYNELSCRIRRGDNPYSCHGEIMALSKSFYKLIKIPKGIYSDDMYIYFLCKSKEFDFKQAPKAEISIRLASTFSDAIRQYGRFLSLDDEITNKFKGIIEREYDTPLKLRLTVILREFIKDPLAAIVMKAIQIFARNSIGFREKPKPTWTRVVRS